MRVALFLLATLTVTNLKAGIASPLTSKSEEQNQVSTIGKIECILDPSIQEFNLEVDNRSYKFSHQNIEENTDIIIPENKKLRTTQTIIGTDSEKAIGTTYNALINKHVEPNKRYKLKLRVRSRDNAGYQILYDLEEI